MKKCIICVVLVLLSVCYLSLTVCADDTLVTVYLTISDYYELTGNSSISSSYIPSSSVSQTGTSIYYSYPSYDYFVSFTSFYTLTSSVNAGTSLGTWIISLPCDFDFVSIGGTLHFACVSPITRWYTYIYPSGYSGTPTTHITSTTTGSAVWYTLNANTNTTTSTTVTEYINTFEIPYEDFSSGYTILVSSITGINTASTSGSTYMSAFAFSDMYYTFYAGSEDLSALIALLESININVVDIDENTKATNTYLQEIIGQNTTIIHQNDTMIYNQELQLEYQETMIGQLDDIITPNEEDVQFQTDLDDEMSEIESELEDVTSGLSDFDDEFLSDYDPDDILSEIGADDLQSSIDDYTASLPDGVSATWWVDMLDWLLTLGIMPVFLIIVFVLGIIRFIMQGLAKQGGSA